MSQLIGVSNRYITGTVKRHYRAKKYPYAYFISEDGKIHTKRVTKAEAVLLKFQIHKRIVVHCTGCGAKFLKLVKHKKDLVACPGCGTLG